MSGSTPNYHWTLPTIGGDASSWGTELNADLGLIDAQVHANQQAGVPIGSITMWAGSVAPTNWLICDGSSLITTTYASLFNVCGYQYGGSGSNFNLPNFQAMFPVGVLSGTTYPGYSGGEATHTLVVGEMPYHNHQIEQTPHVHGITDPGHTHVLVDPTHTHSEVAHSHTYSGVIPGSGLGGGSVGGSASQSTSSVQPSINPSSTGMAIQAATTGVTEAAAFANINNNYTDPAGSSAAHNNLPPFFTINFIIRAV